MAFLFLSLVCFVPGSAIAAIAIYFYEVARPVEGDSQERGRIRKESRKIILWAGVIGGGLWSSNLTPHTN
jgi:hypothetical protein